MLTYQNDIFPMFRPGDIACMNRHPAQDVHLGDNAWMCVPANAQRVYDVLNAGDMPPDGKWPDSKLATFKQWMDEGCHP
jgi:hypothetical protein